MKALLNNTTSIVAASLALGISTAAVAQNSTVQMTGSIELGATGSAADSGSAYSWTRAGGMDLSFAVVASAPDHGFDVFANADVSASGDIGDLEENTPSFVSHSLNLTSAVVGIKGAQGALMASIGGRETAHAYAGDIAVGGAGATTLFLDEANVNRMFDGIEFIYAHGEGPISFSASYEPETGKLSGAAGYDFVTSYGPGRLNGFVFEDQANNSTVLDAVRGYRLGAFVNNGSMKLGGSFAVEDVTTDAAEVNRTSYGLGAVVMVDEGFDISVDFEQTDVAENGGAAETITAFSIGGEMQFGDAMALGASLTQRNGIIGWGPDWSFDDSRYDTTDTELGLKLTVSF